MLGLKLRRLGYAPSTSSRDEENGVGIGIGASYSSSPSSRGSDTNNNDKKDDVCCEEEIIRIVTVDDLQHPTMTCPLVAPPKAAAAAAVVPSPRKTQRRHLPLVVDCLLARLMAAAFLGCFLYHIPSLFLEVAYFPAHGAMMPNGIQGTVVPPVSSLQGNPAAQQQYTMKRFPKRIHVTYTSEDELPPAWKESLQQWRSLHPDWLVQFWSDQDINDFVQKEFPHYYETLFAKYPYKIQRVDAVRYMILLRYGGIYSDLDIFPARNLEGLVGYFEHTTENVNVVLAKTLNAGLTNAFMIAAPNSQFMQCVVEHLPRYQNRFYHIIQWRHWKILSSAGSTYLWGMYGHCGGNQNPREAAVLATESFRRCSVCDTWQTNTPTTSTSSREGWCDTEYLKHSSENSSWHRPDTLFHRLWFQCTMSLFCRPLRACLVMSFILVFWVFPRRRKCCQKRNVVLQQP